MSYHSFSPDIAAEVGLNAAVIYQNIVYWVEKNEANNKHLHNGRYWTYNSVAAFAKLFPYLSPKQIRTALNKLLSAKLLLKGNFSPEKYDRRLWYAVGIPICPNGQVDLPSEQNQNAPKGKSLKNKYKPDNKPSSCGSVQNGGEDKFLKFWEAYPEDRLRNKAACQAEFSKALSLGLTSEIICSIARNYRETSKSYTRAKVKFSDNWLKSQDWAEHLEAQASHEKNYKASLLESLERCKSWIKSQSTMCQHISQDQLQQLLEHRLVTSEEIKTAGISPRRCI